jgi:7-keto-8-aminopelargonate synthetase-like enzyme
MKTRIFLMRKCSTSRAKGLKKNERSCPDRRHGDHPVGQKPVINLCANNYLGLPRPACY